MKARNIKEPTTIAIIGMPGSGSTIVTSFVNSIDSSIIFSEPHRVKKKNVAFYSVYGKHLLSPGNTLAQITDIANNFSVNLRGFKEVWNAKYTDPISLVDSYYPLIDMILVVIREPRRNYASMKWHGHNRGTAGAEKKNIILMYNKLAEKCLVDDRFVPIVYEKFTKDPVKTVDSATGWGLRGKFNRQEFVGGGHRSAMASEKIEPNPRRPSQEKGLLPMIKMYETVVLADSTLGCGPGSDGSNPSGLP